MTYLEFISVASQEALAGANALTSPLLDLEMTAESLVPIVFQTVALKAAADPNKRSLLRRAHTVAFTDGVGTLPADALSECLNGASLSSSTDVTVGQLSAYVPYKQDFIQPRDNAQAQLNWWHVDDTSIFYLPAGEDFDPPASSFTGNLSLLIASVPEIPAAADDDLVVSSEILSDLLEEMATMLRDKVFAHVSEKVA